MPEGYNLKGIIFKLVHLIHVYDAMCGHKLF